MMYVFCMYNTRQLGLANRAAPCIDLLPKHIFFCSLHKLTQVSLSPILSISLAPN